MNGTRIGCRVLYDFGDPRCGDAANHSAADLGEVTSELLRIGTERHPGAQGLAVWIQQLQDRFQVARSTVYRALGTKTESI